MRIGVDLGGTKIEAVALDAAGRELLRRRCDTPAGDYPATVAAVAALVEAVVLGGGLSNVESLYRKVPALLPDYLFSDVLRTRLTPPAHGASSGVRGAAWLWPPE